MKKAKILLAAVAFTAVVGGVFAFKVRNTVTVFTTQVRNASATLPFTNANATIAGQGVGRYYTFTSNSPASLYTFLTNEGA